MPPRFRAPRILRRREINILLELIIRVVSDWRRRCVSRSVGGRGLRETHRRPRRYMCKIKILSRVFFLRRLGRIAKETVAVIFRVSFVSLRRELYINRYSPKMR